MKDSKNRDHIVLLSASAFELLEKVKMQPFTKIVISLLVAQTLVISQMGLFALISQKSIKNIANVVNHLSMRKNWIAKGVPL